VERGWGEAINARLIQLSANEVSAIEFSYRLTPTPLHCINRSFAALNHDFYNGEGRNLIFIEDRSRPSPQIFR
jgi:hypothetical protein